MRAPSPIKLPLIPTHHGELLEIPRVGDITAGFALVETSDNPDNIHFSHRSAAHYVLRASGLANIDSVECFEFMATFNHFSRAHVDGLTAQYWQIHTTENTPHHRASHLLLDRYDVTDLEHGLLKGLCEKLNLPGSDINVPLGPLQHDIVATTLSEALHGRPADTSWECTAQPNTTLVFPNGYDASHSSRPGTLYVHTFFSVVVNEDWENARDISLSRIDATR